MTFDRILLTRPKRKYLFLAYQPNNELNNTQYLKQILASNNFVLYQGLNGEINFNNYGSNLKSLANILSHGHHARSQSLIETNPNLLVTCESFGAAYCGGLSIENYIKEIQSLRDLKIPFLANAAIGDLATNEEIKKYYESIKAKIKKYNDHVQNNPEDAKDIKHVDNYPDLLVSENQKFFFNRSLYVGNESFDFYKRNFDTPTLTNQRRNSKLHSTVIFLVFIIVFFKTIHNRRKFLSKYVTMLVIKIIILMKK